MDGIDVWVLILADGERDKAIHQIGIVKSYTRGYLDSVIQNSDPLEQEMFKPIIGIILPADPPSMTFIEFNQFG